MFGRLHVAPVLLDFLARHAAVSGHLMLSDRVLDLIDEGLTTRANASVTRTSVVRTHERAAASASVRGPC